MKYRECITMLIKYVYIIMLNLRQGFLSVYNEATWNICKSIYAAVYKAMMILEICLRNSWMLILWNCCISESPQLTCIHHRCQGPAMGAHSTVNNEKYLTLRVFWLDNSYPKDLLVEEGTSSSCRKGKRSRRVEYSQTQDKDAWWPSRSL